MFWFYRADLKLEFKIKITLSCPSCNSQDLYVNYADYKTARFTCNKCQRSFNDEEGEPIKELKSNLDTIKKLILEINSLEAHKFK